MPNATSPSSSATTVVSPSMVGASLSASISTFTVCVTVWVPSVAVISKTKISDRGRLGVVNEGEPVSASVSVTSRDPSTCRQE